MIRCDLWCSSIDVAGSTFELIGMPAGLRRRGSTERALDTEFSPGLRHRTKRTVGIHQVPAIEARVHALPRREQIEQWAPAQRTQKEEDHGGWQQPPCG